MSIVRCIQVKSILNKSKLAADEFSANPYVGCAHDCKYCFASYMQRYSRHCEDWGKFVDVKYWPPIPHKEKLYGRKVWIGTVTDAYQPLEAQYCRTLALLQELQGTGCHPSFITKSQLLLRDLPLLKSFEKAQVCCSINTLDERFRWDMDQAATIGKRFNVLQTCKAHDIKTICMIAPIFPVLTNVFAIIDYAQDKCDEIWMDPLNLRGPNRSIILGYIARTFPQLLPIYQQIYEQGDESYWFRLSEQIDEFARQCGLYFNHTEPGFDQPDCPRSACASRHAPLVLCHFGHFADLAYARDPNVNAPRVAPLQEIEPLLQGLKFTQSPSADTLADPDLAATSAPQLQQPAAQIQPNLVAAYQLQLSPDYSAPAQPPSGMSRATYRQDPSNSSIVDSTLNKNKQAPINAHQATLWDFKQPL